MDCVKCKKCRRILFDERHTENLLLKDIHILAGSTNSAFCSSNNDYNIYLNEEFLPNWIKLLIEAENWSKGRIYCPHCDSRVGGFDFICAVKCSCSNILPPVHINKSKVDIVKVAGVSTSNTLSII